MRNLWTYEINLFVFFSLFFYGNMVWFLATLNYVTEFSVQRKKPKIKTTMKTKLKLRSYKKQTKFNESINQVVFRCLSTNYVEMKIIQQRFNLKPASKQNHYNVKQCVYFKMRRKKKKRRIMWCESVNLLIDFTAMWYVICYMPYNLLVPFAIYKTSQQ